MKTYKSEKRYDSHFFIDVYRYAFTFCTSLRPFQSNAYICIHFYEVNTRSSIREMGDFRQHLDSLITVHPSAPDASSTKLYVPLLLLSNKHVYGKYLEERVCIPHEIPEFFCRHSIV